MAVLSGSIPPVLSLAFTGSANQGQQAGWVDASVGGDMFPLNGRATLVSIKTTGTACTATLNSAVPSNYGDDKDVTMVLGVTDEQELLIKNDGRFDQGGVNKGLAAVTYNSVTGVRIKVKTIPGSV